MTRSSGTPDPVRSNSGSASVTESTSSVYPIGCVGRVTVIFPATFSAAGSSARTVLAPSGSTKPHDPSMKWTVTSVGGRLPLASNSRLPSTG